MACSWSYSASLRQLLAYNAAAVSQMVLTVEPAAHESDAADSSLRLATSSTTEVPTITSITSTHTYIHCVTCPETISNPHLCIDVVVGPVHCQAWPLGCAGDLHDSTRGNNVCPQHNAQLLYQSSALQCLIST
jgi:hypothetical protein